MWQVCSFLCDWQFLHWLLLDSFLSNTKIDFAPFSTPLGGDFWGKKCFWRIVVAQWSSVMILSHIRWWVQRELLLSKRRSVYLLALLNLWNLFRSPLPGHNSGSEATSTLLTWLILLRVGPDGLFFCKEYICLIQDKILTEIVSSPPICSVNKQAEMFSMV